jgi:hypothetical protein
MAFSSTVKTFNPELQKGKAIKLGVRIPSTTSYNVVNALIVERVQEDILKVLYIWDDSSTGYISHEITLNEVEASNYIIHEIIA